MDIRPLTGSLGAEIHDIDVSQHLSDNTAEQLKKAWLKYKVLVYRDQTLTIEQHKDFARLFGNLVAIKYGPPTIDEASYVHLVENKNYEEQRKIKLQGNSAILHIDETTQEIPTKGTVLYAVSLPDYGGDTLFVNMSAAYDALSPVIKDLVNALHGSHNVIAKVVMEDALRQGDADAVQQVTKFTRPPTYHPLACTHPETGQKSLLFNPLRTTHFKELNSEESDALRNFLDQHLRRPEFHCRVNWEPKTVVMWDNRCTAHQGVTDYWVGHRLLHRVTLAGDSKPV